MTNENTSIPLEELLLKEIERNETINPNHYYEAKKPSIKMAQDMGMTDAEIESFLNIKIKIEDKANE